MNGKLLSLIIVLAVIFLYVYEWVLLLVCVFVVFMGFVFVCFILMYDNMYDVQVSVTSYIFFQFGD